MRSYSNLGNSNRAAGTSENTEKASTDCREREAIPQVSTWVSSHCTLTCLDYTQLCRRSQYMYFYYTYCTIHSLAEHVAVVYTIIMVISNAKLESISHE